MLAFATCFAIFCYLLAAALQWRTFKGQNTLPSLATKIAAGSAIALHTFILQHSLHLPSGINLGFFSIGSLVAWLVSLVLLISSLRQHIDNLFIGVFPIAAAALALALGFDPGQGKPYSGGLMVHILLSILAYSVLALCACQAVLLQRQSRALKQHITRGLVASLPPLQTMERFLFEMLWTGFALLTAALVTGALYVDDLLDQQLVHKTGLSIVAWLIFATLLAGRVLIGWRGQTAVRWTLGGFGFLMVAFFGSKLVLEFIV